MTSPRLVLGRNPWLFAICLSRVGAYMVSYGAGAAAPLVFGALLDLHGGVQAGRIGWGWAFASLGPAGAGALLAVVALHRLPAAHALTIGHRHAIS